MEFSKYLFISFYKFYFLRSSTFLSIFTFFQNILSIFKISNFKNLNILINKLSDNQFKYKNEYVVHNTNINLSDLNHFGFTCLILNYFKRLGIKPILFGSLQYSSKFKDFNFKFEKPLIFFSKIKNSQLKSILLKIKNEKIENIIKFKFLNVSCGKYAVSSTMRMLRVATIDTKNYHHNLCLIYNLKKSILYADAAYNYLKTFNIKYALFNDRGYVGEGELFDVCVEKKIKCIQYIATYKNNSILFKKFFSKNILEHPSSIGKKYWNKFSEIKLKKQQLQLLDKEIKEGYLTNTWYPSAGTMVGKNLISKKEILKEIGIKNSKKIAIIFPHIFWDGTFFYGDDLFKSYEEWYIETLKLAYKNKNINWIIKAHPSNQTKNIQDKIKENYTDREYKIILDMFGKMPENFYYLSSKSKINSYFLLNLLDYCVTVRGTVGIEAGMRGKLVITAGTGRYDNKGFTNNYMNLKKYENAILNIESISRKKEKMIKYANSFAYISLICKNFCPEDFSFYYTNDLNSKIKLDLKSKKYLKSLNNANILNWIKNDQEDYFQDPKGIWKT